MRAPGPALRRSGLTALALVMSLGLAGCGDSADEAGKSLASDAGSSATAAGSDAAAPEVDADLAAQQEKLDTFVEAARPEMEKVKGMFEDVYSDVTIDAEYPGTIIYTYTFAEQMDATAGAEALESQIPTLQSACDTQLFPQMEQLGITIEPRATYVYLNADGSEISTYTCEPS